ncbi:molybdopterin molybdochelatase [Cryobacterium psychrotolerans]|uniref:Molybdopterin molybdenumtransferase n=1 Tax=Cryobacterium psychrotolerans TaxID=386301 RepID=A0A1G9FGL3_9MICO|nr:MULTISPECIES: gephyrin-like molybdotransferase Glp [Cryobacterium]TFD43172.1 molybdopterin molybdotransferase MoeA [Cryobacterium sp. TMT1-2-1]TFD83797.1 molybdopterin molybdotransferase MoeA [Cryobacterium psychrotolerans]SDK87534.1 molybdopterin molybdochelatase [Cryobacterium psychrotolerans]
MTGHEHNASHEHEHDGRRGDAHPHGRDHEHAHPAPADDCAIPASARSVAEQQGAVLATVAPLPPARVTLDEARGLVLAEDIRSATDIPPFDNSAMDGYAVRRVDVQQASAAAPVTLPVIADLAAGTADNPRIGAGQVARIMTGAPMPDGADAVVPIEDTDRGTDTVTIVRAPAPSAHLRRAGEDVRAGDTVLVAGVRMGPTRLAAAASAGAGTVSAHPAPRVAVISTGSELVPPGQATGRGQIPDSNSFLLAAAVAEAGGVPVRLGSVADDEDALRELLAAQAGLVDAFVLSGGVSVGAYDVVKAVLAPLGTMRFGPVRMQPGKPQGFGRWMPGPDGSPGPVIFALPGNPVSAYVSFEVFVRPALRRMQGHTDLHRPTVTATVADGWTSPSGRAQYMPVTVERDDALTRVRRATSGGSGSHLVAGLGQATGLAIVPEDVTLVAAGDLVTVMLTS